MRRASAAVVVLTLTASCGGDDALTSEAYIAHLNEACVEYAREHDSIGEPDSVYAMREKGPRIVAAFERLVDRVRRLEPPEELAAEARRLLEIGDRQLAVLRALTDAARKGDAAKLQRLVPENDRLNQEADALFRRIGASECAGP